MGGINRILYERELRKQTLKTQAKQIARTENAKKG